MGWLRESAGSVRREISGLLAKGKFLDFPGRDSWYRREEELTRNLVGREVIAAPPSKHIGISLLTRGEFDEGAGRSVCLAKGEVWPQPDLCNKAMWRFTSL